MLEIAVRLAVACGVYDGVFFVLSFFPRDVLNEILNLIESVSEGFSTFSWIPKQRCDQVPDLPIIHLIHPPYPWTRGISQ